MALLGFVRLGSIIKLVFCGELKYLFCERHEDPYDPDLQSSFDMNSRNGLLGPFGRDQIGRR